MNIMLLAMSTYPRDMGLCIADYDNSKEKYTYFSQLEPGCKHFINKLGDLNQRFDKIITLCTAETLIAPCKNEPPKTQSINYNKKEIYISDLSPYEFFKNRLLGFIRNDETCFEYENELGFDTSNLEKFTHFTDSKLYADIDELFECVKVNKDEQEITSSITEIISIINKIHTEKSEKINLYLNAQGGARKNVQIINTVLDMLQSRNYDLAEVSVIEFNNDKSSIEHRMLDVTNSYLINDLAAALNSFLQYGRGDMFVNYYKRYKIKRGIINAPEGNIINAVNEISDSIMLSDVDKFLSGLSELKNSIEVYNETEGKDKYFALIIGDIEESYKDLIESSDIIADLDILIQWCAERKLFQQALTILEAKVPFFVFRYGFLYYKNDDDTKNAFISLKKNAPSYVKYKFDHPTHYFFTQYLYLNKKELTYGIKKDKQNHNATITSLINSKYSYQFKSGDYSVNMKIYSDWFSKKDAIYADKPSDKRQGLAVMAMVTLVECYNEIQKLRNKINHGNGIRNINNASKIIENMIDFLKYIKERSLSAGIKPKGILKKEDIWR